MFISLKHDTPKSAAIQVLDNKGWSIQMGMVYGIISLTLNAVMYTFRTE